MMRDDKLIELFDTYTRDEVTKKPLAEHGAPPRQLPAGAYYEHYELIAREQATAEQRRSDALLHAAWMATQAIDLIKIAQACRKDSAAYASKREKAHRWLGFIQGVLWLCGVYTLDELKEHSRKCSDDPEKEETKR